MTERIYLDNNATTRPLDEVVAAMQPVLTEAYANPSSVHKFGQAVRHKVETARADVAAMIGADPSEIVFTSGGTESINLAIRGVLAYRPKMRRIVTSTVEHSAVQRLCQQLAREGCTIVEVGVDHAGRLNLDELDASLTDDTALVSLVWANNETGVLFDVERAARMTSDRGIALHLDAVQAAGKVKINVAELPVQLLGISAHKFHGPKGAGALYVRKRTRIRPHIIGGHQERDLRGGTENVAAIVGMGVAAQAVSATPPDVHQRIAALRDRLERGICESVPSAVVNGREADRIENTSNIGFRSLAAEAILMLLSEQDICVSAGSACSSGSLEPSHVLTAMAIDPEISHGSIRFSLSRFTTQDEVDRVIAMMPQIVSRLTLASGA